MKTILKSQDISRRTEVGYKTFIYVCVCFSPNGNAEICKHGMGLKFEEYKFTFTLNCISFLV